MSDVVSITGVTSNLRVPGVFVEVQVGAGPVGGNSSDRPIVIVMPKTSSGTYTVNRLYWPRTETEVNTGAGYNSRAARAWRKATAANKGQRIGVICYADSSGGSPVAASTTITVAGTATGTTVWELGVADTKPAVLIQDGDTAAVIAGRMRTALAGNAVVDESGSSASVILTYPHLGTCGGTAGYKPIKLTTNTPGNGITITLPGDLGATTPGVEGSTTEAVNLAAALSANSGTWIYDLIVDVGGNSAALAAVSSFISSQSEPLQGKRGTVITAYNQAISGGTTLAQALNYERITFVNGLACKNAPDEIAANIGALFGKYEASDRTYPFAGYAGQDLLLTAVEDSTQLPDLNDLNDAILGGQMPLSVTPAGKVYIVDATTTRILDSTGTFTDYRAYKRHRVSGADDCGDKLQSTLALNMQGKKIADDPIDTQGRPVYTTVRPPKVIYPRDLKAYAIKVLRDQVNAGQAQDLAAMVESLVVQRSEDNVERILCSVNYRTIDHATQGAVLVSEVTPG